MIETSETSGGEREKREKIVQKLREEWATKKEAKKASGSVEDTFD